MIDRITRCVVTLCCIQLLVSNTQILCITAFSFLPCNHHSTSCSIPAFKTSTTLHSQLEPPEPQLADTDIEDETTGDAYGAKFFGGSAVKDELFDLVEEETATLTMLEEEEEEDNLSFDRFDDKLAFPDVMGKRVGMALQDLIGTTLLEDKYNVSSTEEVISYAKNGEWSSPIRGLGGEDKNSNTSPLDALLNAKEFYNRCRIGIVSAKSVGSGAKQVEIRWVLSVLWPNLWESRVSITGTSILTLSSDETQIVKQVDSIDTDLLSTISSQFFPRFWDMYHIGMTPAAEGLTKLPLSPQTKGKGFLSTYSIYELPPTLAMRPTLIDAEGREGRAAQTVPMHAFTCLIKTAGPYRQKYTAVCPLEVSISKLGDGVSRITWTIPVPADTICAQGSTLSLPPRDEVNDPPRDIAGCSYEYMDRRKVATFSYGGDAQDEAVTELRKKLYQSVTRDGLKPKLDEKGRPQFFFYQNECKNCFTEEGLGMAVYEWRPKFLGGNAVGIELQL